jgi:hypothetical protein
LRQFRNFFLIVGSRLRLTPRDAAGRARRLRVRENIADLRARRRHRRQHHGGNRGRKTGQNNLSKHLARALMGESGS